MMVSTLLLSHFLKPTPIVGWQPEMLLSSKVPFPQPFVLLSLLIEIFALLGNIGLESFSPLPQPFT